MPIYEYVCMRCEEHFEELVRNGEAVSCPECESTNIEKQFSVFAMHGAGQEQSFGGGGGNGCCGGSCGCGQ